jgi:hypothetical protein
MKNTFKQHTYTCKCGALTKEYVWDSELPKTKVKCTECSKVLSSKDLLKVGKTQAVSIRTPTKNR